MKQRRVQAQLARLALRMTTFNIWDASEFINPGDKAIA
jgi:hypothetical protein